MQDDYDYPLSVEAQIAERLGGMVSPYDGTGFESLKESDPVPGGHRPVGYRDDCRTTKTAAAAYPGGRERHAG